MKSDHKLLKNNCVSRFSSIALAFFVIFSFQSYEALNFFREVLLAGNPEAAAKVALHHADVLGQQRLNEANFEHQKNLNKLKERQERSQLRTEYMRKQQEVEAFKKKLAAVFAGVKKMLTPRNVQLLVLFISSLAIVILFFRSLFPKLIEWIFEKSLPGIIEKKFLPPAWYEILYGFIMNIPPKKFESRYHELILDEKTKARLDDFVRQEKRVNEIAKKRGIVPLRQNVLVYGPPGTGKTMLAEAIAAETREFFLLIPGGFLMQLKREEGIRIFIKTLHSAIRIAKMYGICVNILIDEADSVFPPRGTDKATKYTTDITNTFLAMFPKPWQPHIRLWFISNLAKDGMDKAAQNRAADVIGIMNPDPKSCAKILKLYLKKHRKENRESGVNVHIADALFDKHKWENIGKLLYDRSYNGRSIEASVMKMYREVIYGGDMKKGKEAVIDEELIKKHIPDLAINYQYTDN